MQLNKKYDLSSKNFPSNNFYPAWWARVKRMARLSRGCGKVNLAPLSKGKS